MHPKEDFEHSRDDHRERIYHAATSSHDGRRTLLSGALALTVFLLILALSARQVTAPGPATHVIEGGIAATTDIDRLIAEDQPALKQLAQSNPASTFPIPGYPIRVYVNRDEVNLPPAQLRDHLLARSSAVVYKEGLGAFDRTGNQSFSRFSSLGLLDFLAGQISESNHDRATLFALLLTIALALLSGWVLAAHHGWPRVRVIGIAALAGALPLVFLFGIAWLIAGQFGGSDPFEQDLQEIGRSVLMVPLRNATIVAIGGAILTALGPGFGYLDRRFAAAELPAFEPASPDDDPALD